jgi:hypothetical protein
MRCTYLRQLGRHPPGHSWVLLLQLPKSTEETMNNLL